MAGSRLRADPLADDTIASILASVPADKQWDAIGIVNRQLAQWQSNGILAAWKADEATPPAIAAALESFVRRGSVLPDWADSDKIGRAETLFFDMSMMSCTLLFCASLPECYVMPDLAGVLHVAGQLEQHTDYRVRSTAAMIFPVMMKGGLTTPEGGGIAQILKVRLIHATIRHLILRGNPGDAVREGAPQQIPPLPIVATNMQQAMYANGWNIAGDGLPCNQEELAYTLLTFNYVFLRGLRKLGIGLRTADEQAYLHTWNVVGHILGIETGMMADTMDQAGALFARMQSDGRANPYLPETRPALGAALMQTMENQIPLRLLKPFPVLMTRYLCGQQTAQDLGITGRVNILSRALFVGGMAVTRVVDAAVRLLLPEFSLCRLLTRVVGYQFTVKLLMDETRPLKLPAGLLNQVNSTVGAWDIDRKAPKWVNKLEQRLTGRAKRNHAGGELPC